MLEIFWLPVIFLGTAFMYALENVYISDLFI